jgi:CO/xanthine dehydrogenase FAD-binding subunit
MRPLAGGTDLLPRMKLDLAGEGTRRAVHPSNLAPAHGP